jgi:hypothetical protein
MDHVALLNSCLHVFCQVKSSLVKQKLYCCAYINQFHQFHNHVWMNQMNQFYSHVWMNQLYCVSR